MTDRKRTIKTPAGKPSIPVPRIRQAVRKVVAERKRKEAEDTVTAFIGRGDDEPTAEEIQRFKEAEEELSNLTAKEEGRLKVSCIFIDVPKECRWFVSNDCVAPPSHILECLEGHKRLILNDWGKLRALQVFMLLVVNSPRRVKSIAGQTGRDVLVREAQDD